MVIGEKRKFRKLVAVYLLKRITVSDNETTQLAFDHQEIGEVVDEVVLRMDYQIIEHFSQNLYESPNKAIEELVANGFDAFASHVQVFVPGPYTSNCVLVWDDGMSMGIEELKQLWWIAKSPKTENNRISMHKGQTRKIIGKFGIGKLASYSVGQVISHLCKHDSSYYIVSVDYAPLHGNESQKQVSYDNPIKTPIKLLNEDEARSLALGLFNSPPDKFDEFFSADTWTLAIIEQLKVETLPEGRLRWVLGNGMPLRPDFAIEVNGHAVQSSLDKQAIVAWDYGVEQVKEAITVRWKEPFSEDELPDPPIFGNETGLDPANPNAEIPYVKFNFLGIVWGTIRLFDESLLGYRSNDNGRSHGYFLEVRGRLTNPDDAQMYLSDPSFHTFYRSQFVISADDLDKELLADRQRLRKDKSILELQVLQEVLISLARRAIEKRDEERKEEKSTRSMLPLSSRVYYRDPLNALLSKLPSYDSQPFDLRDVRVERKDLGDTEPLSVIDIDENAFLINSRHPYFRAIQERIGQSKTARELLRFLDLFAIAERLLEGHLFEIGIHDSDIREIVTWREGLFNQIAASYSTSPELINEMYRTSFTGGRKFELSLAQVFADMGFYAIHDGAPGNKDVLVMAAGGPEGFKLTLEAKGSKNPLGNQDAAVSGAANHRDAAHADHAIVVAREFMGFGSSSDPESAAIMEECRSVGGVSIMDLKSVELLHGVINKYCYPLNLLRDTFTNLESPASKLSNIQMLDNPTSGFDYSCLLNQIWVRQQGEARDEWVPYRSIHQQEGWKEQYSFKDFERRLSAIETLANGRIKLRQQAREVYLNQAPAMIIQQINRSFDGGHFELFNLSKSYDSESS